MTNEQFQEKFEKLKKERLPIAGNPLTINEVIFILREDDEVSDYLLNFQTDTEFAFGFLKEGFFPVKSLALKVDSMEYEWPEDAEIPTLYLEIKK